MLHEIKHRHTGAVLYAHECESIRECVEIAVQESVDLSCADLARAFLADASLAGARLQYANLDHASINRASLNGADLTYATLIYVDAICANLCNALITFADLSASRFDGARLRSADLRDARLTGVNVNCADFARTDLIDGGHDFRGYRFWVWRDDNTPVYRAGCHEWRDPEEWRRHYDSDYYDNNGDPDECLARLEFMRDMALQRWG